jgi:hypothetical protein
MARKSRKMRNPTAAKREAMGLAWSDGEMDQPELEKMLAKKGFRIVKLTDVTITKELLRVAVVKCAKVPGNEIPALVDFLLKEMILQVS